MKRPMLSQPRNTIPIILLMACGRLAAQDGPKGLDFEQSKVGEMPSGWRVPTPGYNAMVKAKGAKRGDRFVRLSSEKKGDRAEFGNIMQNFDASPYRDKVVRFRAAVRADVEEMNRVQLWMRVDRKNHQMGFFDNMQDRPITSHEWKYYEIVGEVEEDAMTINIGMMLMTQGRADLDDVSFEILSDAKRLPAEKPRTLSPRGLENLVAFTRLLGYVQYFYPSLQATKTDWDAFAIQGIRAVESANSSEELVKALADMFRPIAPTLRVFLTGERPEDPSDLERPKNTSKFRVVRWKHEGLGSSGTRAGYSPYHSRLERKKVPENGLPKGFFDPADPFTAELGGGAACMVPLSLYIATDEAAAERANDPESDSDSVGVARYTASDRATRLADVALAWNVLQHFYPYFDVVETDWPAALQSALKKAATDRDERAFLDTLRELVAKLHDGHGFVHHPCDRPSGVLPLNWTWVGGELVVTHVDLPRAGGPMPGDALESISGRSIDELVREAAPLIPAATPQWARRNMLWKFRSGPGNESVQLSLRRPSGERFTASVSYQVGNAKVFEEGRPDKIAELKPGIFYVDILRANDGDFEAVIPKLKKARGIIFDYRGYPQNITWNTVFQHLIKERIASPQWHVPLVLRPDQQELTFLQSEWYIDPGPPYLSAKRAFLIDSCAISRAEVDLGIVEHYKLGELVGEPTAGTNGNVNQTKLPGGYTFMWTGMKVLKHDGSRHHGVGILPTIPVSPTIKGIAEARDEMLEKAINVVSE